MIGLSAIAIIAIFKTLDGECATINRDYFVNKYFETSDNNQLNILPEYQIERYIFPAILPNSIDDIVNDDDSEYRNSTILYRIASGPKSSNTVGKGVAFIQHGIICDTESSCTVNKLQRATVYILVDQGYDVWLGLSNSSVTESSESNEQLDTDRLKKIAGFILETTNQKELLVIGYFNGTVQFFGMSSPIVITEQSRLSKWLDYIPGVKIAKKYYDKGKKFLTGRYENIIDTFDALGKKADLILDDSPIRTLKKAVLRAWGFAIEKVTPTLKVDDLSKTINNPDVYLDTPRLITKYGYDAETHQVETEDGYLLSVHRISGSKKYPPMKGKPVIFLQHGMLTSSADWILTGPSNALGYLLADNGYDVWMGNSRGNTYSRAHVNLSTTGSEFWDFTFHEMGIHDLPATIDYIIAITDQRKINYLGHSEGTTSFFVMLSEKPEYNEKIIKFIAYAPVAYLGNVRSPIVQFFATFDTPLYGALRLLNVHEFFPTNSLLTKIGRDVCEARTFFQVVCTNAAFMVLGYDSTQLNKHTVPIILGHTPAGAAVKQFVHYAQLFKSKKFRQYHYYRPAKNLAKYGMSEPPEYKITNVKIPVAIFSAGNDWLADPRDVEILTKELTNTEVSKVRIDFFNHIDFTYAIHARSLVYEPTIEYLRRSIFKNHTI